MLTKLNFTQNPIDLFNIDENCLKWQKRNGYIICKIDYHKPLEEAYGYKSIDYFVFVLKGTIWYQHLNSEDDICNQKNALEVNEGEYAFIPSGNYYYWSGNEGVKIVVVSYNAPKEIFDALSGDNINITFRDDGPMP